MSAEALKPQFKSWMGEFHFDDGGERQEQRWSALQKLAAEADEKDIETLLALTLNARNGASPESTAKILSPFQATDPEFTVAQNAREIQVLSAASLTHIAMSRGRELSAIAALSLSTGLVGGARKPILPLDLHALTDKALSALSHGVGRRPDVPLVKVVPKISFEAQAAKITAQPDWNVTAQALSACGTLSDAGLQNLVNQCATITRAVITTLRQQDEELQMLWWLLGGRSDDLDIAFDAIAAEVQPLVLGKELAVHTTLLPGPRSIRALLQKAGLKTRGKVSLEAAINACKPEWLAPLGTTSQISSVAHPIHFAIARQVETGPSPDWAANWAAVTGIPRDISLPPLILAEQFYRERLLLQRYE